MVHRSGLFRFPMPAFRAFCVFSALSALCLAQAGCFQWLGAASEKISGKQVNAQYPGLLSRSVAIVVYADKATLWEYPQAREEIAAFVAQRMRSDLSDDKTAVKLLDYKAVIDYQDATLNWESLPVKEIGRHFSVDRVLYIELLQYSAREPGSSDLLRGRIKANCAVYETDTPSDTPAWQEPFDEAWPKQQPEDVLKSNELIVRKRVLDNFAEELVGRFHDHRDFEKHVRDE